MVGIHNTLAFINQALLIRNMEWPCWGGRTCWVLLPFQGGGTRLSVKGKDSCSLSRACLWQAASSLPLASLIFPAFFFQPFLPCFKPHGTFIVDFHTRTRSVLPPLTAAGPNLHSFFHFVYFHRVQCCCHCCGLFLVTSIITRALALSVARPPGVKTFMFVVSSAHHKQTGVYHLSRWGVASCSRQLL